jgi:hypothetical protein
VLPEHAADQQRRAEVLPTRPVEGFIERRSAKEAAKVLDALAAIEARGLEVVMTRQLKGKLWNSRCRRRESSTWC